MAAMASGGKKMELKMEKAGWHFEGAGHASRMFCLRSRQSPWRSTRPCAGRKRVEQHSWGATGEPPALFQALLREYVGYRQRVSSLLFFLRPRQCLPLFSFCCVRLLRLPHAHQEQLKDRMTELLAHLPFDPIDYDPQPFAVFTEEALRRGAAAPRMQLIVLWRQAIVKPEA